AIIHRVRRLVLSELAAEEQTRRNQPSHERTRVLVEKMGALPLSCNGSLRVLIPIANCGRDFFKATAQMQIALRVGNLNSGRPQLTKNRVIQIAAEPSWPIAHFLAPNHELEIDGALADAVEKYAWLRLCKRRWVLFRGSNQCLAHLVRITVGRHADWNSEAHF